MFSIPGVWFWKKEIKAIVSQIEAEGILVVGQPLPEKLPDPDDETFLEVALPIDGTILITVNKKHFPASAAQKVTVLNLGEFVSFYHGTKTGGN